MKIEAFFWDFWRDNAHSSVHTCLSCPKLPQNPAFALPKGAAMAGIETLERGSVSAYGSVPLQSNLDNVFYVSIKGKFTFCSFFFSPATVFELLFKEYCEKEKMTALLDM